VKTATAKHQFNFTKTALKTAIVLLIVYTISRSTFSVLNYVAVHLTDSRFKEIELAIYFYQMRYQQLPGDDDRRYISDTAWDDAHALTTGNADGIIQYGSQYGSESALVWQHLRQAGLLGGQADDSRAVRVFPGAEFVVFSGAIYDDYGTYVCAHQLSNSVALGLLGYTTNTNARNRRFIWVSRSAYPASDSISTNSGGSQIICSRLWW
jgi:hypothetical protein